MDVDDGGRGIDDGLGEALTFVQCFFGARFDDQWPNMSNDRFEQSDLILTP